MTISKPMTLKGFNGTISFDGAVITITRKFWDARGSLGVGEKRIPVNQITSIKFRPAGVFANGFIRFTIAGAVENHAHGKQSYDVARDENAVTYVGRQNTPAFEKLRATIDAAIATPVQPVTAHPARQDVADQLRKLAELRDMGALTEAEFAVAKTRLLRQD